MCVGVCWSVALVFVVVLACVMVSALARVGVFVCVMLCVGVSALLSVCVGVVVGVCARVRVCVCWCVGVVLLGVLVSCVSVFVCV